MYKKVLFIILFMNSISVCSQSSNPSVENIYKSLFDKKLKYVQFSDSLSLTEGSEIKKKLKADFLLLNISKSSKLRFKKFTYNNPVSDFYFRDSIFLFDKKICIDNLFYNKRMLKDEAPLRLNYASGYAFSLNLKKYISLFFWDSTLITSSETYYIVLFDITDKKNIMTYFFDEQMSFTPDCFGNLNNDGKLDFIKWTYGKKINCYTLVGNKFKMIKNKFIIVEEKRYSEFSINWNKSKWKKNRNKK